MLRRHRQLRADFSKLKDTLLFAAALAIAHVIRTHWQWDIFGIGEYLFSRGWKIFDPNRGIEPFSKFAWLYVILIPVVPFILEWQGFYNRPLIPRRSDTAWKLLKGCIATTVGVIIWTFFMKESPARGVIVLYGAVSFVLVFISEEFMRLYNKRHITRSQFRRKFVLIGSPEDTEPMARHFQLHADEGIEVLAQLNLNDYSVEHLMHLLHEHSASGIIINARHTYFGEIEKAIQACELEGLEVWLLADFFKTKISRTSFDEFHNRPMLVFHSAPEISWQSMIKRLIDVVGALLILILFSWLFLLLAFLVKRSSPGPVLFRQRRCGLHGEPFTMLKFRTMFSDAEQRKAELAALNEMSGPVFKVSNDPRVTKVGRFMRRRSFDELPQVINVLRGEMSLVGPRPLPVDEVRRFDDMAHRRRLSVKPGLTCLWQVSGRNNVKDFRDWVRLDLAYIDNWSLWLDVKILFRTIPVVLVGTGAK